MANIIIQPFRFDGQSRQTHPKLALWTPTSVAVTPAFCQSHRRRLQWSTGLNGLMHNFPIKLKLALTVPGFVLLTQ